MDAHIAKVLETGRTIDITTTGRQSGESRRKEIWYHIVDGRTYITGTPGPRSWYANLLTDPDFTFHVKEGATADLAARATVVDDPQERHRVLAIITARVGGTDLDDWVARSPLVEVEFTG